MANDRTPALEVVSRQFELARRKIRELEEAARRELPRKPPGDDDSGAAPPASPLRR